MIRNATYRCAHPDCPGYSYKASEQAHPPETCTDDGRRVRELTHDIIEQFPHKDLDIETVSEVARKWLYVTGTDGTVRLRVYGRTMARIRTELGLTLKRTV